MHIGNNIKYWRIYRDMNQTKLASILGVSDKTVSSWEINRTDPKIEMIEKICQALKCKKTDIIGYDELDPKEPTKIPVLGSVPAGIPIGAIQDIIDYEEIDRETANSGDYFALQIKGNSMKPRICKGDVGLSQSRRFRNHILHYR